MRHGLTTTAAALSLAAALAGCSTLPRQYCETGADCDEISGLDPVQGESDDSTEVCTVNQETILAALRQNSEEVCHELAAAREAYMACAVEEGCDAFNWLPFDDNPCDRELDDVNDLQEEAGNRCNE